MRYSALSLALAGPIAVRAASGTGTTTRYWDCCKPSCAWEGKASVSAPALTCDKNDNPISDANAVSGCDGGTSYTCSNYSPWKVNDNLAYGFAATNIGGGTEASWCCACYAITFTSGSVQGKTMVVQSTNTGSDLGSNHFDLLMPGGGVGIFDGCTSEFGTALPGEQYGGISSASQCSSFPAVLQDGCNWRFDWFENADNPTISFEQVQCPTEITNISGCIRDDDGDFPVFTASGSSSGSSSTSSAAASTKAASSSQTSSTSTSVVAEQTEAVETQAPATSQKSETAVAEQSETAAQTQTQVAETTKNTQTAVQTEAPTAEETTTSVSQALQTKTRTKASGCGIRKSTTLGSGSTAVSAAAASTSTIAIYQQCNGSKDLFPNGALPCASGSTCVYSNDWYSQCVPN